MPSSTTSWFWPSSICQLSEAAKPSNKNARAQVLAFLFVPKAHIESHGNKWCANDCGDRFGWLGSDEYPMISMT